MNPEIEKEKKNINSNLTDGIYYGIWEDCHISIEYKGLKHIVEVTVPLSKNHSEKVVVFIKGDNMKFQRFKNL